MDEFSEDEARRILAGEPDAWELRQRESSELLRYRQRERLVNELIKQALVRGCRESDCWDCDALATVAVDVRAFKVSE